MNTDDYKCPHCGSTNDTWFDRSFMLDADGNEVEHEGMCFRCEDCGKNISAPAEYYNPKTAMETNPENSMNNQQPIGYPMTPYGEALANVDRLQRELAAVTKERDEAKAALVDTGDDSLCNVRRLRADLAALRAELDEAKRAEDAVIACHRATLTERDQLRASHERLAQANDLLYLEVEELRKDKARLESAIRWALSETDFSQRPKHAGAYWWRTELRRRAAIDAAAGFKPSNDGQGQSLRNT